MSADADQGDDLRFQHILACPQPEIPVHRVECPGGDTGCGEQQQRKGRAAAGLEAIEWSAARSVARDAVAAAPECLDRLAVSIRVELAAQPTDEDFDRIAVALEILFIELFGEFGL